VPESFTASFTAAAAIALGREEDRTRPPHTELTAAAKLGFAVALLAACLSRYEAWPVAAVLAIALAARSRPRARGAPTPARAPLLLATVVAFGPLAWMAWNAYAHGDALHFFERVARFKRDLGEGSPDALSALLLYPRLLVTMRPDVLFAIGAAVAVTRMFASSRAEVLARWRVPLLCAAAQIAFLAYGNARDGAPAHHSERALLGVVFIGAAFAAQVLAEARGRAGGALAAALVGTSWLVTAALTLRTVPGAGDADNRTSQVAAGKKLREEDAPHVVVTPCSYEHFALVAAFGAPERVQMLPRTGAPVSPSCPIVERR
jgi:hypothetical protein